jgi:hypothetical protein
VKAEPVTVIVPPGDPEVAEIVTLAARAGLADSVKPAAMLKMTARIRRILGTPDFRLSIPFLPHTEAERLDEFIKRLPDILNIPSSIYNAATNVKLFFSFYKFI